MRISFCTLLSTFVIFFDPARAVEIPKIEFRGPRNEPYGIRHNDIVYPFNTFEHLEGQDPRFPLLPVTPIAWDKIKRDGVFVGQFTGTHWYRTHPNGEIAMVGVINEMVEFTPQDGDILIREGYRWAIKEGVFREFVGEKEKDRN